MHLQAAPWGTVLAPLIIIALQIAGSQAAWAGDQAWVRQYPCGALRPEFPSMELTPFWIDIFRGTWDSRNGEPELTLDVLAVHNESMHTCEDIDIGAFKESLDFQVLGNSVGQLKKFSSQCPLPVTNDLTPTGHMRFSSYHITYDFKRSLRFQTIISRFRFRRPNGTELDCGVAKITPDIGKSASAALTLTPLCLLIFISVCSWRAHESDLSFSSLLKHDSVLAGQGPFWATILDLTSYLRQLQFIFLSASMSIEYPGFYVPVVSKLAWASLLYWKGFVHYGRSHKGVDGGMYVSNASYGPEFMTQMLGYPDMLQTLANSLINLALLALPVFFVLSLVFLKASRPSHTASLPYGSTLKKAAGMAGGMALCFFSVPLLSYMAYDLILVGYLPNYRIGLAVLMLLIIVGANYFLTRRIDDQLQYKPITAHIGRAHNEESVISFQRGLQMFVRHLPHSLPLLQAIGVGSLQDYPIAQLSILSGCEAAALLYQGFHGKGRFFSSFSTYFTASRLLAASLNFAFISSASETTKHWIGYALLGIHALVALVGYFIKAVWQLYGTFVGSDDPSKDGLGHGGDRGTSSLNGGIILSDLPSRASSNSTEYGMGQAGSPVLQYGKQSTSSFTRAPRSRSATFIPHSHQPSAHALAAADSQVALTPSKSIGETCFDLDSALSQVSPSAGVDYSIREVDLYYGTPVGDAGSMRLSTPGSSSTSEPSRTSENSQSRPWRLGLRLPKIRPTKSEEQKGFQVMRPPRPLPPPPPTPTPSSPPSPSPSPSPSPQSSK